jgi:predicted nucleotidyltransferase
MSLELVLEILCSHRKQFLFAYVFGSVVNGSADEHSDVDIILVRDTALPFFDRVREVFDLFFPFEKVDMLIYTEEEFSTMIEEGGRFFLENAVEQGVRVEGEQDGSSPLA